MREKPERRTLLSDIGQIITGWCPHHDSPVNKKTGTSIMDIITDRKIPGTNRGISKKLEYSHRQVGFVQLWAGILALIIVIVAAYLSPETFLLLLIPIGALLFGISFFSTLTVEISSEFIGVIFGPIPLLKRKVLFDTISSYKLVKNPWYYGYGIRYIPKGTLYNISGPHALELTLKTGKKIQFGTDEPEKLAEVFKQVTSHYSFNSV